MPTLISREDVIRCIHEEGGSPPCLMCAIAAGRVGDLHVVFEDDEALVFLPRYVRRWGELCVMPKAHVTSFSALDEETWLHLQVLVRRSARVVERLMQPRRCYVTMTGSAAGELTQSSEHLHTHILPIIDANDRPAKALSWEGGVLVATRDEWLPLQARYAAAFDAER
jgi:diadenosine tetraphosphate (Ap4A) HIT family hydrolase